jgi:uncharacterized membrane protein YkvA (DUF1232 family)
MARGRATDVTPGERRARRRRRGRSATLRRLIAGLALLPLAERAPRYARLLWALVNDARTPAARKAVLAGAIGYVLLGRDVVPDRVPILGSLDDVVVVALGLDLFLAGIDDATLDEKLAAVGIPRVAYDEDVARIRRLVPGPIRRLIHRLPGALAVAGQAIAQSGVGPRLRASLPREGSIA